MSCGKKAWAEELQDMRYAETLHKFRSISEHKVIDNIDRAVDDIDRLISTDPSLTRVQWARLDSAIKLLKELI